MKTGLPFLLSLVLFSPLSFCQTNQIRLQNPSFEGTPALGAKQLNLSGWSDCGQPGNTPPDVHPVPNGTFGVTQEPLDGNTYLGMVVRIDNTWEAVRQSLASPLEPDSTYIFSIYLCRSEVYRSRRRYPEDENLNTPAILRIWGASYFNCRREELLGETVAVTHTDWLRYDFKFSPKKKHEFLILEAYYEQESDYSYNGNILLDHASAIVEVAPDFVFPEDELTGGSEVNKESEMGLPAANPDTLRFEFSEPHMGTEFKITCYHRSDTIAKMAAAKAFQRIEQLEQILSDYREDSEVSQLSATAGTGERRKVSQDLYNVLLAAFNVSRRTSGAFDVTVGSLSKLWRRAFRQQQFPSVEEIEMAAVPVGYQFLKFHDDGSVELTQAGAALDLGAIGKGYAVDEAMKVLRQQGISSALIAGGGDLLASNPPPGKDGWQIERFVFQNGELATEPMLLANLAVSTSGDTYRFLEWEGKRYSHIINPRTGMGLTTRQLVSVTAPSSAEADAWATALSVHADLSVYTWLKKKGIEIWFSEN